MSKIKVIGVSVSAGEYKGYAFKNLVLHTTREDIHTNGLRAEQIKIKFRNLSDALNINRSAAEIDRLTPADFQNLIGKEISAYYDQYRQVTQIVVYGDEEKPNTAK